MSRNTEASIKNLEKYIGQLSIQLAAQPSSSVFFNTINSMKNENHKVVELRNKVVSSIPNASGLKKQVSGSEKKSKYKEEGDQNGN